jgi:hypothetical protein
VHQFETKVETGNDAPMATWRRRAIKAFPDLRDDLNQPDYTIYRLFFDLLPGVREAHRASDEDRLGSIYEFAEWCARQKAQPLSNAAGVAFYEHIFDERWMWPDAAAWLARDIRADCEELWRARLSAKDFAEAMRTLASTPPR